MLSWEQAAKQYPSIIEIDPKTGALNLYADHHMLSSLRTCEGIFRESIVNSIAPKQGRNWYLEFGIWFHRSLELFYDAEKIGRPVICSEWCEQAMELWAKSD